MSIDTLMVICAVTNTITAVFFYTERAYGWMAFSVAMAVMTAGLATV